MSGGLLLLFSLDLAHIVVTGGESFLRPGQTVSPAGFVVREIAFALACFLRFRLFAPRERRASASQLLLVVALLPSLFHLHFAGRRITGDALYYYVFTRSLVRDADVNFTNEYTHYKLLDRGDHIMPTSTGHRRTIYAIGSGLLWTPFFLAADVFGTLRSSLGYSVDFSGYGPLHINAVALGSFLFGAVGLFVIHAFLRAHFGDRLASGAALLLGWASFLPWYLAQQPLTSHTASVLVVAVFFLLREKGVMNSAAGSLAMGLVIGLGMSVRWQNGVYLLLPGVDFLQLLWRRQNVAATTKRIVLMATGVLVGVAPQMLAWKAIYDEYFLPYPPHGADFVRLGRPFVLETLFSSRHGLLSWTPVFWLSGVGLLALARQSPRRYAILWAPLLIMTYVNMSSGDWWAGGSFSNRRFDSLLPVLALGLAAFLDRSLRVVRARPAISLALVCLGAGAWNGSFARALSTGDAKDDGAASLSARALGSATAVSRTVGFPTTWPASWIFAARLRATPDRYDLADGKYLFYRQNNLDGIADLGSAGDDALLLDGFGSARQDGAITHRPFADGARLVVSLDEPEDLSVSFFGRTSGEGAGLEILVNDVAVGRIPWTQEWGSASIETPASVWRRGLNTVTFRGASADLERVEFTRRGR